MAEMVMKPVLVHRMVSLSVLFKQPFHSRLGLSICSWYVQNTLANRRWKSGRHDGCRVEIASKCLGRVASSY